jgi:hypothetical protein
LAGIAEDQDFFDHGVSSLTVIEMQILVEDVLKVAAPTSDLMAHPTIGEWIEIYTREADASTGSRDAGTAENSVQCEA